MANDKRGRGPDRLGGAQPPSSGGYGDIDRSAQRRVGESDAPDVKQQEPRELEGLSGMNPATALPPDEHDEQLDQEIERALVQAEERDEPPPPIENPDDEVDPD